MKLALGTVQFGLHYGIANMGGQVTRTEVKAMLQLAADHKIDTLDTAISYGESESCLGQVGVQDFKVVTKLSGVPEGCVDISAWLQGELHASLKRLGVSKVYGLLLHRPEQLLGWNGRAIYQALLTVKEQGMVQKIGISIYAPEDLAAISSLYPIDLVQAPFNLVDRRLQVTSWLQRLKDKQVEIHTRSAFLQGLLLMPRAAIPPEFAPWGDLWDRWHQWLADNNVSALQACLVFPLGCPEIDRVVVGADSAAQLGQILDAAKGTLPHNLLDLQCDALNLINPSMWKKL